MLELNTISGAFLLPGIIGGLIIIGVILRNVVPIFRKMLVPASILGGIIGFILINLKIIPIPPSVFEEISFHLLNLSFMSITLASTKKAEHKIAKEKDVSYKGGLWMAMMWGALISVQIVIGGLIAFIYNKAVDADFSPFYGAINAHGFAQGPVQAIAMAKTWMASPGGDGLPDLVQVGLFFAVIGYLAASLVGVPMCNRFFKKGLTTLPRADVDKELATGIYDRQTEKILGNQSTHRSNVDTLTVQIAIMVTTYLVTFLITSIIDPKHETIVYSMMFVWAIIMTNIVKIILQKIKKDHLIDPGVQTSITNFCTDCALVAVMLSLTVGVIVKYIVPLAVISVLCVLVSWVMTYKFAQQTGQYVAERTATVFGIATGTAITGMLLLRVLDPEYETNVADEIVWWNIFQMVAGAVAVGVAPFALYMGFWPWMGFNVLWGGIMLFMVHRVGKSLKKLSLQS